MNELPTEVATDAVESVRAAALLAASFYATTTTTTAAAAAHDSASAGAGGEPEPPPAPAFDLLQQLRCVGIRGALWVHCTRMHDSPHARTWLCPP